jgi:hypothetical protein
VPWLRLDDNFTSHPKVAQLSDREFRVHVRALCYCARHHTEGVLPVLREIPGLTPKVAEQLVAVGLWDVGTDVPLQIHDFGEYNGKASEREAARLRKRAQRDRDKGVTQA